MKQIITRSILVSGPLVAFGAFAADVMTDLNNKMSEQLSDAHREMRILTAFSGNSHLSRFDFSVSVDAGKVVLGGSVNDDVNRDLAERIAIDVDGIKAVVNHIVVDDRFYQAHPPMQHIGGNSRRWTN